MTINIIMENVEIKTLIDVTKTKALRLNQGTQLEIDQNRNFITLLQCCEIRSIVSYDSQPTSEVVDVKDLEFGANYKGKHRVWTFVVRTDRDGVYINDEGNPVGKLIDDLHAVPIIKSLTETINIDKAVFDTKGPLTANVVIKSLNA